MRVVVTHDVDHLSVLEHWGDMVIPKFIGLSLIEWKKGLISGDELLYRFKEITKNEWDNIKKLARYDMKHSVNSAFYFAMSKGLGISYSTKKSGKRISWLIKNGFEVGVHGIEYENFDKMKKEFEKFRSLSGMDTFGIRMHYLRNSQKTFENLQHLGYIYDSTIYSEDLKQPYLIGKLVEIPLHLMDTYLFSPFFKSMSFEEAVEYTESIMKKVPENGVFVILFHQRYFSKSFMRWMEWYRWLIETCEDRGYEFINPMEVAKWKLNL